MTFTFTSKFFKFSIITLLFFGIANAQENSELNLPENQKSEFWKHVRFGGGLGLNFSNRYTNITIAPNAIYKFNDKFGLGTGLNANYSKHKNDFEATVLGVSIISLYKPIQEFQLSAEFEENNVNYKNLLYDTKTNYWHPSLFLGAGYSIGDFGAIGNKIRYFI